MSSTTALPSKSIAAPGDHRTHLPTRAEVLDTVPDRCRVRSTTRSFASLGMSLAIVGALVALASTIPMSWAWAPVWLAYWGACGTAAVGLWVIAHECGHGAFSSNARIADAVGYILHSALLVPYFSWQRSHAVHHSYTNHTELGETHVPSKATDATNSRVAGGRPLTASATAGRILTNLLFGWPAYLLIGAASSPVRGRTNHFWPIAPFTTELFPRRWHARVWLSALGVAAVIALLTGWAVAAGTATPVILMYVGPYLVVNAWLVAYTWLQHSDTDIPHYGTDEWNWMLGAFQTVDRPYPALFDVLHHHIGTTHVAHHIDHRIPHYHAAEATNAIRAAFPQWYRFDPRPIHTALWTTASRCLVIDRTEPDAGWFFKQETPTSDALS